MITDLGRLNPFLDIWLTEGEMKGSSSGQPAKFTATDSYEWLAGGYFLLHRFDADMPDGNVKGIEVIGYSQESNSYPMHSFDSLGSTSMMQARVRRTGGRSPVRTFASRGGFLKTRRFLRASGSGTRVKELPGSPG